jgi:hypothetical protein
MLDLSLDPRATGVLVDVDAGREVVGEPPFSSEPGLAAFASSNRRNCSLFITAAVGARYVVRGVDRGFELEDQKVVTIRVRVGYGPGPAERWATLTPELEVGTGDFAGTLAPQQGAFRHVRRIFGAYQLATGRASKVPSQVILRRTWQFLSHSTVCPYPSFPATCLMNERVETTRLGAGSLMMSLLSHSPISSRPQWAVGWTRTQQPCGNA